MFVLPNRARSSRAAKRSSKSCNRICVFVKKNTHYDDALFKGEGLF